jgi:hypothetical protein
VPVDAEAREGDRRPHDGGVQAVCGEGALDQALTGEELARAAVELDDLREHGVDPRGGELARLGDGLEAAQIDGGLERAAVSSAQVIGALPVKITKAFFPLKLVFSSTSAARAALAVPITRTHKAKLVVIRIAPSELDSRARDCTTRLRRGGRQPRGSTRRGGRTRRRRRGSGRRRARLW